MRPRHALMTLVRGYRLLLKPWLGNACRFEPTCSLYALQALQRHGSLAGTTLAVGRLLRCHPWCAGGCDDVPLKAPALFTRLGLASPHDCSRPARSDGLDSRASAPKEPVHSQESAS